MDQVKDVADIPRRFVKEGTQVSWLFSCTHYVCDRVHKADMVLFE